MISFCSLSCNAKNELRTFVESLVFHNPNINFEICIAHDDRVNDGSNEAIQSLQSQYPQLKVVRNTVRDSEDYLEKLLQYYETHKNFNFDFRYHLRDNLNEYKQGTLCNPQETYLWIALGYLFNKAASIATGDILMFAPADYIWPISLVELEEYVINNRRDGFFYGKFGGSYLPISNEPVELLQQMIQGPPPTSKMSRNYLRYPSKLTDHYLLDFDNRSLYQLGTDEYQEQFVNVCRQTKNTDAYADMHHGTHIMTRRTWETIGGFTEEFYGRAWPDDKMNAHAMKNFWTDASTIPTGFSFSFIPMAKWQTGLDKRHPDNYSGEELQQVDPCIGKHPIQGRKYYQTYLHHGYYNCEYTTNINRELDSEFAFRELRGREAPVVRLVK
jgi:hypothetical protein